jgi:hypothetical protein
MKTNYQNNITISKYIVIVMLTVLTFTRCKAPSSNKTADTTTNELSVKHTIDKDVSFIDLISNPEKYTGQAIRIIGYLNIEFEGNALYFHKEDYDFNNYKNGLWIDISLADMHTKLYREANKKYVLIEGTFNMYNKGHMGSYHGSIGKITRVEVRK